MRYGNKADKEEYPLLEAARNHTDRNYKKRLCCWLVIRLLSATIPVLEFVGHEADTTVEITVVMTNQEPAIPLSVTTV